ncbi:helix-turn-helix domain-containing protein [Haloferacaceae archaeon DSL9]
MSVVVEFTVPTTACALGRSIQTAPELTIELDRVVPTGDTVMPFFWVWGPVTSPFETAARSEPAIDQLTAVDRIETGTLFAAQWNRDAAGTLRGIVQSDGTILHARANQERWLFQVRFHGADETAAFRTFCSENDVPINIQRITTDPDHQSDRRYDLTTEQREALAVAYQAGYFDEPRRATLDELADELGISPRAVTGRLRRGQAKLIERTGIGVAPDTTSQA